LNVNVLEIQIQSPNATDGSETALPLHGIRPCCPA
jgi:hypothetical protein